MYGYLANTRERPALCKAPKKQKPLASHEDEVCGSSHSFHADIRYPISGYYQLQVIN